MTLPPVSANLSPRSVQLMKKAQELETSFLSEMLSYCGLDGQTGAFCGGIGEDQFASFLREAQAKAMVEKGGLGLAHNIFQSLARRDVAKS